MQKFTVLLLLISLVACAEFAGVYKIDIEQGNVITEEMVDQLRPGMTKRQVRFIMGMPLIKDTFNLQRWDYLHSLSIAGDEREQQHLSLFFNEEERLVSMSGSDFNPNAALPRK